LSHAPAFVHQAAQHKSIELKIVFLPTNSQYFFNCCSKVYRD